VTHFPVDAPKVKVSKTFELLGFSLVRERGHIAMIRENADNDGQVDDSRGRLMVATWVREAFDLDIDWHADDVTDSEDPDDLLLVLEADTICRNHRGL